MAQAGHQPVLKKTRRRLLKRKENLTGKPEVPPPLQLQSAPICSLRRFAQRRFSTTLGLRFPQLAGKFLDERRRRIMRSRIEPMKKTARSLRKHRDLILNHFRAQKEFSSGVLEGRG
jgi:transposase